MLSKKSFTFPFGNLYLKRGTQIQIHEFFFFLAYIFSLDFYWVNSKAKLQLYPTFGNQGEATLCSPRHGQPACFQVGLLGDELPRRHREGLEGVAQRRTTSHCEFPEVLTWPGPSAVCSELRSYPRGLVVRSWVASLSRSVFRSPPRWKKACSVRGVSEGWERLHVFGKPPWADPGVAFGPLLLAPVSSIPHPLQDSCPHRLPLGSSVLARCSQTASFLRDLLLWSFQEQSVPRLTRALLALCADAARGEEGSPSKSNWGRWLKRSFKFCVRGWFTQLAKTSSYRWLTPDNYPVLSSLAASSSCMMGCYLNLTLSSSQSYVSDSKHASFMITCTNWAV